MKRDQSAIAVWLDRVIQFSSYAAVVAIIILSLVPGSARPQTGAPGQGEHIIAYLITAFLFGIRTRTWREILPTAAVLILGAGILETAQLWVPDRNAQFFDFVASSVGILIGVVIGRALAPLYRKVLALLPGPFTGRTSS